MTTTPKRPDWALPPGVPRGVWDYSLSRSMAADYDTFHQGNYLLELDAQFVREFARGETAVDLGCGSGRLTRVLLDLGMSVAAVDLSTHMLTQTMKSNADHADHLIPIQANLVDLRGLCDASFSTAICMFSTLGMVQHRTNRQSVLSQVFRILKPGGVFIVHVHSLWGQAYTSIGRSWLLRSAFDRSMEWGDRIYPYRGVPGMFLHLFRPSEIRSDLRRAGFRLVKIHALDARRQSHLKRPWLLGDIRADGWLIAAERTHDSLGVPAN